MTYLLCIAMAIMGAVATSATILLVLCFRVRAQRSRALAAFRAWTDALLDTLKFMEYRITRHNPSYCKVIADYMVALNSFYKPIEQFKSTFGNSHPITQNLRAIISFYEGVFQPFYALIIDDRRPLELRVQKIQDYKDDIQLLPIWEQLIKSVSIKHIVQELLSSFLRPSKTEAFREIASIEEWYRFCSREEFYLPIPEFENQMIKDRDFDIAAD